MATIQINEKRFDNIQVIICDKDGTIAEFDTMWGNWIKSWTDQLLTLTAAQHPDANISQLTLDLDRSLGFDRPNLSVVPESPVAVSTLEKISTVAMTVLYQSGVAWHSAEELVGEVNAVPIVMTAEMVVPVGDVKGTFSHWAAAGITVLIATSDDREPALAATRLMGVDGLVDGYYCGNDPIPNKPNPAAIDIICKDYEVTPDQILMVGDALSDIAFGRNGKLAGCIGISGGSGDTDALIAAADVVIDSVDKIAVVNEMSD